MKTPLWKPIVIVLTLLVCGLLLYPPQERLKLGIDLAGGTTLVYQVNFDPDDPDTQSTLETTIDVLQRRVDPNGVRNLIWQPQGRDRIEIQMPLASPEVRERRQTYITLRNALLETNLTSGQIDAAAQTGQIPANLSEEQRARFQELVDAYAAMSQAREPYVEASNALRQAEQMLGQLSDETPEDERQQVEAALEEQRQELFAATRRYVEARNRYEAAREAVTGNNIDARALDNALNASTSALSAAQFATLRQQLPPDRLPASELDAFAQKIASGEKVSHRDVELRALALRFPGRAEQIAKVAEAHTAYESVRGPLDDPEDLKQMLRGAGVLEFRIAPQPGMVIDLDEYVADLMERGPRGGTNKPYRWFRVDPGFADTPRELEAMQTDAASFMANHRMIGRNYGDEVYVLLGNTPQNSLTQAQEGWQVTGATRTSDDRGFRAVGFALNPVGAQLFGVLTSNHIGQPMAIVLDGRVMSAPNINSAITGGQGIIQGGSGGFGIAEQEYLVRTFQAGALSATLSPEPISEKTTGPQFGHDNLVSGLQAAVLALVIVAIFMAVYYFAWGVVADFALFANVVIILGVMSLLDATFTLPGIAGIVLTIGMAVDANVLIFERIREELQRNADLRTAVRLGYDKALSTIIDANITTLITCVVLGYTATAEVKGFAITLGIGVVASMFTALFCTRVIVDIFLDATNVKNVGMLATVVPSVRKMLTPNINWLGKRYLFMGISGVLLVAGVIAIGMRGGDMFDIEFRGGTQVTFRLADDKWLTMEEASQRMQQAAEASGIATLERNRGATLVAQGELQNGAAREFSIATLHTDPNAVSDAYRDAFADVLQVERAIHFDGEDAAFGDAPVFAVSADRLGDVINRADAEQNVTDFRGGVAILLENMNPAISAQEIGERINRMQLQPAFEQMPFRPATVIGLTPAGVDDSGEPLYTSAVVLAADEQVNYLDDPESFHMAGGFSENQWKLVRDAMVRDAIFGSITNFSPAVSGTMQQQAIVALVLSMLAVLAYIWFRFGSLRYSLGAIFALAHDVVVALGLVAIMSLLYLNAGHLGLLMLSDFKINLALVAAMLTLVGYSLNDTIVIFDRIRENRGRLARATPAIINDSINQTISRTLLTSFTTLLALLVLYVFGGEGVHGFAAMMIIGVVVGTYSSIAIATQVLLWGYKGAWGESALATEPAVNNPAPSKPTA